MQSAEITAREDSPPPRGNACAACGAPVDADDRFCHACGATQPEPVRERAAEPAATRYLRCQTCGAEVSTDVTQRSYVCPFCDSTYVVEFSPEESGRQRPEFVIGFAIAPESASEKFDAWFSQNSWFRPGDLKTAHEIVDRLTGIYLPFWSFSMLAESDWSASIGEYWYRTETYTVTVNGKTQTRTRRVQETEWWPLAGQHHRYYSGYLVSGSKGLSQAEGQTLYPYYLAALKRYEPYFLAGWLSEEYSLSRDDALARCQEEFRRQEQQNISAFLPGDTHSELQARTEFSHASSDLILLPVYLLRYRYGEKTYQFLLNGQTGRVAGEKPISKQRIAVAVGVGLAMIAAVVLVYLWLAGR